MIILTLQKTKSTLFQSSAHMPIAKLAPISPCQEVLYYKPWMRTDKLEQVVQEKKWITKEENTLKTAQLETKKSKHLLAFL